MGIANSKKRSFYILKESPLPTLPIYQVNPMFAFRRLTPDEAIRGLNFRRPHSATFQCHCRVSGQTQLWRTMKPHECAQWVINGDLLIIEAQRIIENQGFQGTGKAKLQQVYQYLQSPPDEGMGQI